ncbi:MAG TPA: FecR domain-containing protein [Thermoanaerobaculia bacterium]|nr:FecR domain-containing protein [Thermoanaerobaculia bacterium]
MNPGRKDRRTRDWYKVSVDTLRGWLIFLLLAAAASAGYVGFRIWERYAIQREAARAIDDARVLFQRLRGEGSLTGFKIEYDAAWAGIERARGLYAQSRFDDSLASAERSREMLLSLLDASKHSRDSGEAQFIAVQGRVEYRRSDRGEWEQARGRVMLRPGDYVKTGANGSAEIMFTDGTLYTVRADTLFLVSARTAGGGNKQAIELQYGWINLNTAQSSSKVATPQAEAVVSNESEAVVSYDEGRREGRISAYRGAVDVRAGTDTRRLGALQSVRQAAGKLAGVETLPDAPKLVRPQENADFDFDTQKQLRLTWEAVAGSERYALQISRNRLFVDNVIDAPDRRTTEATLGVQGEGTFLWRVAAVTAGNLRGPWSAPGRFRVVSAKAVAGSGDKEPPELQVQEIQSYGSIFIVGGHTEPGATVTVNEEPVTVQADGSFNKTIQMVQSGWAFLDIKAVDASGNQANHRARVFVESL